jgi:phosphatidate phosphatase APP1
MDFVIASDIDDTILKTYATDFFRMMRVTFLNNVRTGAIKSVRYVVEVDNNIY